MNFPDGYGTEKRSRMSFNALTELLIQNILLFSRMGVLYNGMFDFNKLGEGEKAKNVKNLGKLYL